MLDETNSTTLLTRPFRQTAMNFCSIAVIPHISVLNVLCSFSRWVPPVMFLVLFSFALPRSVMFMYFLSFPLYGSSLLSHSFSLLFPSVPYILYCSSASSGPSSFLLYIFATVSISLWNIPYKLIQFLNSFSILNSIAKLCILDNISYILIISRKFFQQPLSPHPLACIPFFRFSHNIPCSVFP